MRKTIVSNKAAFSLIASGCSRKLVLRFFEDKEIELAEKAEVLDILLQNNGEKHDIARLLRAAGEEMVSRLFLPTRTGIYPVSNDPGHVQLFEVLK